LDSCCRLIPASPSNRLLLLLLLLRDSELVATLIGGKPTEITRGGDG
jgi:hypothetical protein